jgi:hypothetical protein
MPTLTPSANDDDDDDDVLSFLEEIARLIRESDEAERALFLRRSIRRHAPTGDVTKTS